MKKVISILLCALLLVSSLAFSASADETKTLVQFGNADGTPMQIAYDASMSDWTNKTEYVILPGCTFVIPSGRLLNVAFDSSLVVMEGATLQVNGQLNVTGEMNVYGTLRGENIVGTGPINCQVRFPSIEQNNLDLDSKIKVHYYLSGNDDMYGDIAAKPENYKTVLSYGEDIMVPYNTYIFVRIEIRENGDEDKYNDALYPLYHNSTRVQFAQNACPILVTTAGDISYGSWKEDSTYYNTYTITLPEGTGYTVYGRNGELGEVTVKHGQSFSFRVELEEEYNQSAYEVYVFNGNGWTDLDKDEMLENGIKPAVADANGFYTISGVKGNYSIFVEGVVTNEMLDIMSTIFNLFRQIWETIAQVFAELFGEGGLGSIFGSVTA